VNSAMRNVGASELSGRDSSAEPPDREPQPSGAPAGARLQDKGSRSFAVQAVAVEHQFGQTAVLADVSLDIASGDFVTLLGPSGSGKTTLLRIIAGLLQPTSGRILIADRDVTRLPPQRRDVGLVFQSYALFPHLTVSENLAYPLRIRHVKRAEIARRVEEALARVGLEDIGQRMPAQLSGGQQQRVAVARVLIYRPTVLLMDEPLGALDRQLRLHMQRELRRLQQDLKFTCVYVTHDQEEALTMSDRVAVMAGGRIQQIDDPITLYRQPVNRFVAEFVGRMNLISGRVVEQLGDRLRIGLPDGGELLAAGTAGARVGAAVTAAIRPEAIEVNPARPVDVRCTARVAELTFLGNVLELTCRLPHGTSLVVQMTGGAAVTIEVGTSVELGWDLGATRTFPEAGGLHDEIRAE
jgi:putative spermidine/putrescine transport system ATP-binding protein